MNNIQLFIGNVEVEFETVPEILYTYQIDDLTNPTIVKNGYSKTITIKGTKINNDLFGHFWNVERVQVNGQNTSSSIYFNASKKIDFTLFINNELIEEGYVKLDTVRNLNGIFEYDISLFGSVGNFFYNLSTTTEGNQMKLSDLDFNRDINFTINVDTVKTAWNTLKSTTPIKQTNIWKTINFMPAYNGKPDDFDSDKMIIDVTKTNLPQSKTEDGKTYNAKDNKWVLAELPEEMTEWETRDLRSYLQRPVIRMKEIITACCNPINNGGYNVNLDTDFFNKDNPYYEDAWITLPMLNKLEYNNSTQILQDSELITANTTGTLNGYMTQDLIFNIGEYPTDTINNLQLKATINLNNNTDYYSTSYIWFQNNYSNAIHNGWYCMGSLFVQLVAYNDDIIVGASDIYNLTTPVRHNGGLYYGKNEDYTDGKYFTPYLDKKIYNYLGDFKNGSFFRENEEEATIFNFDIDNINSPITSLKIVYYWGATKNKIKKQTSTSLFNTTKDISAFAYNRDMEYIDITTPQTHNISIDSTNINAILQDNLGKTNTYINKQILLNTDSTPADYLLSYCKLFGLYFSKDPYTNTINIQTRKTFYNKNNIVDITDNIDYNNEITITPITFENKWVEFSLEEEETKINKEYELKYGNKYGVKILNTGYEFDSDKKQLLDSNILKSGIEVLEKSKYYTTFNNNNSRPFFNNITYKLYNNDSSIDVNGTIPNSNILGINENNGLKYYDLFPKLQLHKDGSTNDGNNILVFFNGFKNTINDRANPIYYYLTDDNYYQTILNDGQACWLLCNGDAQLNGKNISLQLSEIPVFERYQTDNNGTTVKKSFDFGTPQELFIPLYNITDDVNIYSNYWREFLTDLYSIENKLLTLSVRLPNKNGIELLRDFYWFNNSIWRINKIADWKLGTDDYTKVTFVKVQDVENYTTVSPFKNNKIKLKASNYKVSRLGGGIEITVTSLKQIDWTLTSNLNTFYFNKTKGNGNDIILLDVPESPNLTSPFIIKVNVTDAEGNITTINITQSYENETKFNITPNCILIPNDGGEFKIDYNWVNQGNNKINTFEVLGDIDANVTLEDNFCTVSVTESQYETKFKRGSILIHNNIYGDELFMEQVPSELSFGKEGGTYKFQWNYATVKYSELPYWVGIKDDVLTVLPNYYNTERVSKIKIENESTVVYVSIYQEEGVGLPQELPKISPDAVYFEKNGGEQFIQININNTWFVKESLDWINLSLTNGDKNSIIKITTDANTGDTRSGYITIKNNYTKEEHKVYVSQLGNLSVREVTVEPIVLDVDYKGGDFDLTINFQNRNGSFVDVITDLAQSDFTWIEDVGTMKVSIPINLDKEQKTYTVIFSTIIGDYTITINQSEVIDLINFENNDIKTSADEKILPIEINTNFDWYIDEYPEWIGLNTNQGTIGRENLDIYISENDSVLDRYTAIVFRNKVTNEYVDTLRITQKGKDEILIVYPDELYIDGNGGDFQITIENNSEWTIELI